VAKEGLQEAFELMLDVHIRSENAVGAQQLLGELQTPSAEFVRRVDALVDEAAERRDRYEKLSAQAADLDARQGARARSLFATSQVLVWFPTGLVLGYLDRAGVFTAGYWTFLVMILGLCGGIGLAGIIWREQFYANQRAARYFQGMLIGSITLLVGLLAFWAMDAPFRMVITIGIGLEAVIFTLNGLHIDRALFVGGTVFLICFALAVAFPQAMYEIFGVANALGFGLAAWTWGRWHHQANAEPTDR